MLIRLLPLKLVCFIGRQIGFVFYFIDTSHRKIAVNNLTNSLGNYHSESEITSIAKENFRRLGEVYLSVLKTAHISLKNLSDILSVKGLEHLDLSQRNDGSNPSFMFAIGHFGNFELYANAGLFAPEFDVGTTYRGFNQPWVEKLVTKIRNRSGCHYFDRRFEGKKLMSFMKRPNSITGLLADQNAGRSGIELPLFGLPCSTNPAPAIFSLRYNLRLHCCLCRRVGLGRWELELGPEISTHTNGNARSVNDIMSDINATYEDYIREDPANWFWVHNRWKRPDRAKKHSKIEHLPN
jgi:lauroyl/myristoyl acyltransferase